jgi:hypothetical protein
MTIFYFCKIFKKEAINRDDNQDDDNEYRHTMTNLVEIYDGTVLYCTMYNVNTWFPDFLFQTDTKPSSPPLTT